MQPRVAVRRGLLPGMALLVTAALAACASPSEPASSASVDPSSPPPPPSASPEPTVQPLSSLDQPMPISCALDMGIVPPPQQAVDGAVPALRVELLGQGSDRLAMVALVGDELVVTPSVEAGDPTDVVEAAIARVEQTGNPIEQEWVMGEAVDWTFDDLCEGVGVMHASVAAGANVMSFSMSVDGYLEVGLLEGDSLPQSVVDFDAQHPGIVRTFVDVQHFG